MGKRFFNHWENHIDKVFQFLSESRARTAGLCADWPALLYHTVRAIGYPSLENWCQMTFIRKALSFTDWHEAALHLPSFSFRRFVIEKRYDVRSCRRCIQ